MGIAEPATGTGTSVGTMVRKVPVRDSLSVIAVGSGSIGAAGAGAGGGRPGSKAAVPGPLLFAAAAAAAGVTDGRAGDLP